MKSHALTVQQDSVVANLVRASTALAEAKTIQQTKAIVDVAAAAEIYAKRQQLGEEAIGIAHSIKLEALRKLGEMLKETPKNEGAKGLAGGGTRGSKKEPRVDEAPTLAELGLDKKTSSIAQKLADLPEEAFKQVQDGHESIAKAIAAVKETKPAPVKPLKPVDVIPDELTELREANAEQGATIKELLAENESMAKLLEADDQIAAAAAENKKLREMNRILEERVRGLQNECNAAKRAAQSWQRKFESLNRKAA
jgi:hypothetical protein